MSRVVIAMSGGVDSSVAAALLKEQGHDVIGIMLRLWSEPAAEQDDGVARVSENKCCSLESVYDAKRVAQKLDIPFYLLNVAEKFRETIVDFFYDEYTAGRTPNPCLRCNRYIRFTELLGHAQSLGAEYLATGHYVRVDTDPQTGERRLRKGADSLKDQSYVLHTLTQEQLRHALFPLGELTKPEVRLLAEKYGLAVARKPESQEICFVAQNDYRGFVKRYAHLRAEQEKETAAEPIPGQLPGPIYTTDGKYLGEHTGLAFYTVGQRKGLGITTAEPMHVLAIEADRNAIIVGPASALEKSDFVMHDVNFPRGSVFADTFTGFVKIRYKAPEMPAVIHPLPQNRAAVHLLQPARSITPGQAAVVYGGPDSSEVLCGGLIE